MAPNPPTTRDRLVRETLNLPFDEAQKKLQEAGYRSDNKTFSNWRYKVRKATGKRTKTHKYTAPPDGLPTLTAFVAKFDASVPTTEIVRQAIEAKYKNASVKSVNGIRWKLANGLTTGSRAASAANQAANNSPQGSNGAAQPAPKSAPSERDAAFRTARNQLFALFMRLGMDTVEEVYEEFKHINDHLQGS